LPSTIEHVYRELKDEGLVVLAINLAQKRDLVAEWVKSRGVTSTVLLVDRDGRLIGRAIGERQWDGEQGKALLRLLLARKA